MLAKTLPGKVSQLHAAKLRDDVALDVHLVARHGRGLEAVVTQPLRPIAHVLADGQLARVGIVALRDANRGGVVGRFRLLVEVEGTDVLLPLLHRLVQLAAALRAGPERASL